MAAVYPAGPEPIIRTLVEIISELKNFKKIQIGIDEFNYIDFSKKHSFWSITAEKK